MLLALRSSSACLVKQMRITNYNYKYTNTNTNTITIAIEIATANATFCS